MSFWSGRNNEGEEDAFCDNKDQIIWIRNIPGNYLELLGTLIHEIWHVRHHRNEKGGHGRLWQQRMMRAHYRARDLHLWSLALQLAYEVAIFGDRDSPAQKKTKSPAESPD